MATDFALKMPELTSQPEQRAVRRQATLQLALHTASPFGLQTTLHPAGTLETCCCAED